MQRRTGRASSMPTGLAAGAVTSVLITILGSAVLAKLVDGEMLQESSIGYGIMIMLIGAACLGAMVSCNKVKRQRLLVCMASGGIYFGMLLCITAMFFGGQYSGVGVTALLIFCGSFLAVLPGFREKRGGKRVKLKIPNG